MASSSTSLFTPLALNNLLLKNRIVLSPMCQYSSTNGFPNRWHTIHLGQYSFYHYGMVLTEATAIVSEGRITPKCTGIWDDKHIEVWKEIVNFNHSNKSIIGIQLAHAGRKSSTRVPFEKGTIAVAENENGWPNKVYGPSKNIPWSQDYHTPIEMTIAQIKDLCKSFADAAIRADKAGFDFIEIHAAHGYLLSSFLSPLSNKRTDIYGGNIENRMRIVIEVIDAIRKVWNKPLGIRLSCSEWVEGGWDINDTLILVDKIASKVDMIDCSSGGNHKDQKLKAGPSYQVHFAKAVKGRLSQIGFSNVKVGAVGMITEPKQADDIISSNSADFVLLARQALREPSFPLRAARELGIRIPYVDQYARSEILPVRLPSKF